MQYMLFTSVQALHSSALKLSLKDNIPNLKHGMIYMSIFQTQIVFGFLIISVFFSHRFNVFYQIKKVQPDMEIVTCVETFQTKSLRSVKHKE